VTLNSLDACDVSVPISLQQAEHELITAWRMPPYDCLSPPTDCVSWSDSPLFLLSPGMGTVLY